MHVFICVSVSCVYPGVSVTGQMFIWPPDINDPLSWSAVCSGWPFQPTADPLWPLHFYPSMGNVLREWIWDIHSVRLWGWKATSWDFSTECQNPKSVLKVNLCVATLSAVAVDIDPSRHVRTCHIHLTMQIRTVAYIHTLCKAHYVLVADQKIAKILKNDTMTPTHTNIAIQLCSFLSVSHVRAPSCYLACHSHTLPSAPSMTLR